MDPATAIALCKENIQPLRHGRNAMQLGTALRAQEDTEAQQLLMQEKQMYEDAIKNYTGDDPLENWYEYILWTEQSFPKSGHESHIGKILQQCLTAFEKDPKYHQDRRYVRLWINYISMQKNPLELYQLLYNNGIGTMVADMYRAWAFELEQVEDYKRADQVYLMGISAHAEPREELDFAHKNFQLAMGRRMLGHDERSEIPLSEQRQAFSSLRAIKAGRRVANVRTGHRVRDYLPGVIPQSSANHGSTSNAKIQIYHDEPVNVDPKGSSILDHIPIEETVHKENTIKPGPWNNGSRKGPLIPPSVKPAFKVHEDTPDESYDMEHVRLFPNHTPFYDGSKYAAYLGVPVFVPEPNNPGIILKPHYPKELVYANNVDRSMEEIRAERYLQRYPKNQENQNVMEELSTQEESLNSINAVGQIETELQEIDRREKRKFEQEEMAQQRRQQRQMEQQTRELEQYELQRQRLASEQQLKLEQERREAEQRELERREAEQRELERREAEQRELERREAEQRELERLRNKQLELERQRREAELEKQRREAEIERQRREAEIERQRREAEFERQRREADERQRREVELERQRFEAKKLKELEAVRIEAERIEAERIEAQRMEAELQNSQRKQQNSSFLMHRHHTPNASTESILGQSLTVNTKEAISVVQDLWHSPTMHSPGPIINRPMRVPETRPKLSFDIHMDSSMTQQHAMHTTKNDHHHPNPNYHVQSYQDQENHQHFLNSYNHEAPTYPSHGIPDPYRYQVPLHHDHMIHHHHNQSQHLHPHQQHNDTRNLQQHQSHILSPHQQHPLMHQESPVQQMQMHSGHQMHHSPHVQPTHASPHQQVMHQSPQMHHHHQSPHVQQQQAYHSRHSQAHESSHSQHLPVSHVQQQHMYAPTNMLPGNMGAYQQQYSMNLPCSPNQHQAENAKQSLHFTPYIESEAENKPYRMPDQLPYIKSPGMNRRDLKYLESADNKENATVPVDFNSCVEGAIPKQTEDNLYNIDESLGTAPLSGPNDTCFTEAFTSPLISSTPLTNQFKHTYRTKESGQPVYPVQNVMIPPQGTSDSTGGEHEKLSVIMESTREYVSSSSGSSAHTRTVGLGFTSIREELVPIKEQSTSQETENNDIFVAPEQNYEDPMRAKIQAVHAQSPRTVQRNVDQITSEIKNNCDLRIPFKLNSEPSEEPKVAMEYEFQEPMEEVEEEEFVLPTGDINPFDKTLIAGLLRNMKFPQANHSDGYVRLNINLNKIVPSSMITLGTEAYDVEKCLGKGTYGTVVKATDLQTRQIVALKTQKPAWVWEYYIAREIKARLSNPHMLRGFMDITRAYVTDNGSVLVSQFSKYGTLLAVTNQVKIATGKPLVESLAIFFTIEMLQIVEHLHKCQIIHGDIKPDNFLLMHLPTEDVRPTIQLIDFGCSIDMSLFPEDTKFRQIIKTQDFTCVEMQTGRPWTYQTDLYCLAGSSHCLLFGNYMRVSHNGSRWMINSKLPRYAKKAAWEMFFTQLLNIDSCDEMPDLSNLRNVMEESLAEMSEFQGKIRQFANVLNKR